MKLKFVDKSNKDLLELVSQLDDWFSKRYGEDYESYRVRNGLEHVGCAIVAYEGDTPIGCGCWRPYDEVTAELKRVFVQEKYRKNGYAAKIIGALEKNAAQTGAHRMILETAIDMQHAIDCYRALGYQDAERFGSYANDTTVWCMQKSISDGAMR